MITVDKTSKRVENCAVQWCSLRFSPAPSVSERVYRRLMTPRKASVAVTVQTGLAANYNDKNSANTCSHCRTVRVRHDR